MAQKTAPVPRSFRSHRTAGRALVAAVAGTLLVASGVPFAQLGQPAGALGSAITGTVFRDYDGNGVRGVREPGQATITVTGFGPSGAVYGPVQTAADGTYSLTAIPAGTKVRVEATGVPSYLRPAPIGSNNGSLVRFAAEGDTGVDMAVMNPADYCQNNPDLLLPCFLNGNQADGASNGVLYRLPYGGATGGGTTGGAVVANATDTGTTYGVAYQRSSKRAFTASYVRRHTGILNNKPGALYKIDNPASASPAVSQWVDLATIGIPVGSVPINGTLAGQRDLGTKNGAGALSRDPVIALVGKVGIGDIDMSEDDTSLYVVSLAAKKLYKVTLPPNGSAPTAADVTDLGIGSGACDQPFGIKPLDGKVYVGVTCTTSLAAEVRAYDVASGTWSASPVLSVDLTEATYGKGCAVIWTNPDTGCEWNVWSDVPDSTWITQGPATRPTAILSDISFADNGDMVLGFRDRTGDQVGFFNYFYPTGSDATTVEGTSGGDLLRACKTTTGFVLQGGAGCAVKVANAQGPGGGEWYSADNYAGGHEETAQGALAVQRGSGLLASAQMDPNDIRSGGVTTYNDDAGTKSAGFQVALESGSANAASGTGRLGKANGLGDLELLCDQAPIEIGNRVWLDINGNGVQDPDEPPITTGVTVKLFNAADVEIGSTVTDGNGNYVFSSTTIVGLTPNTTGFKISVDVTQAALAPYKPTTPDAAALAGDTTQDNSDSDGIPSGSVVTNAVNTGSPGSNDHTHDFGFVPAYSVGNRVWLDDGSGTGGVANDGLRNGTEPGVDGVTMRLYLADTSGNPSTVAKDFNGVDVADQVTAGGGFYRFDNLPPGKYIVVLDKNTATNLAGTSSSTGSGQKADPNTDLDNDDNGLDTPLAAGSVLPGGIRSGVIDLFGSEPTTDTDGGAIAGSEAPNDRSNRTVDFGFAPGYSLGNRVWIDTDDNGTQESTEAGVDAVVVQLLDSTGTTVLASATTANGGFYRFDGLAAGDYRVRIAASNFVGAGPLAGFASSTPSVANPNTDVDKDDNGIQPATFAAYLSDGVLSGPVTLGPPAEPLLEDKDPVTSSSDAPDARSNLSVDFGFRTVGASLGDRVWSDVNKNGAQDAGEPGVPGVTVRLIDATTGLPVTDLFDNPVAPQTTDANGNYLFTVLKPGTYKVVFDPATLPTGTTFTVKDTGADDVDSDANPTTGVTDAIVLAADGKIRTVDAGIVSPVVVGPTTTVGGSTPTTNPSVVTYPPAPPAYPVITTTVAPPPTVATTLAPTPVTPAPTVAPTTTPVTVAPTTVPVGSIVSEVFLDRNRNKVNDPDEPGIPGVTITIVGPGVEITSTTGTAGSTAPVMVPPGTYTVTLTSGLKTRSVRVVTVTVSANGTATASFPVDGATVEGVVQDVAQIGGNTLSYTGQATAPLTALAGLLILGGSALLLVGRRRRKAE